MSVRKRPSSRLAIHGCYNNANFGDLLILDVMAHHVEQTLGIAPFCARIRDESVPFVHADVGRSPIDLLDVDAAFFGGGGYFCDYFRRSLGYSIPARIWQACKIPYVVAGVGVGPTISPAAIRQFRVVADGAQALCVRDEESADQLASFGVERDRIEVTGDVVPGLTPDMIPADALAAAKELLGANESGKRRLLVQWGSAGRRIFRANPPFVARDPHDSLIELLKNLKETFAGRDDVEVVWLQHGQGSTAAATRGAVEQFLPGTHFVSSPDHWVVAAMLSLVDGVFTTMLHYGITAWTLGTPCCAWAGHGKVRRFYKQIGRERFVAPLGEELDRVRSWMTDFVDSPADFDRERQGSREELRQASMRNYEVIGEHLAPALGIEWSARSTRSLP